MWIGIAALVIGGIAAYIGYLQYRIMREQRSTAVTNIAPVASSVDPETSILQAPIPPGPPIVMKDRDFDREFGNALQKDGWEIIKPGRDSVFKYERRGFERIFVDHHGESCQVVIGGTADKPDNVPLKRRQITDGAKKLLRMAYSMSARPDIGYCFLWDAGSDNPTIRLDDGSELAGYQAVEIYKSLSGNMLVRPHPTEHNLYLLTELGQGWVQDIIERRLI